MAEQLRPRFRYFVPLTQEEVKNQFLQAFKKVNKTGFTGSALKYHIVIDYHPKLRHFWSPQIDLNLEPFENGTLIRGLLGPRPNVWTIFMFFNSVAGFLGIIGVIVGTGQSSMENTPYAYWLIPISGIMFTVIYFIGKMGKQIAHEESVKLHQFLIDQLEDYNELELSDL
ncbi:MAG: hypothetical protein ACPGVC_04390 [Salibacteraceae bacterium]